MKIKFRKVLYSFWLCSSFNKLCFEPTGYLIEKWFHYNIYSHFVSLIAITYCCGHTNENTIDSANNEVSRSMEKTASTADDECSLSIKGSSIKRNSHWWTHDRSTIFLRMNAIIIAFILCVLLKDSITFIQLNFIFVFVIQIHSLFILWKRIGNVMPKHQPWIQIIINVMQPTIYGRHGGRIMGWSRLCVRTCLKQASTT